MSLINKIVVISVVLPCLFIRAESMEQKFFAQCSIQGFHVDLYRDQLTKDFPVTAMVYRGALMPTLAAAQVGGLDKQSDGTYRFLVHFEGSWGVPDFSSKNCRPVTELESALVNGREVIPILACLYFIESMDEFQKKGLDQLIKEGRAIAVKSRLLCEISANTAIDTGPCEKITFLDQKIPVSPHGKCSLP